MSDAISSLSTIGFILAAMALVALFETIIPLHARSRWNELHLVPNLTLTFITFATNLGLNIAIIAALAWLQIAGVGLLNVVAVSPVLSALIVVFVLDFAFYVAHVTMHKVPVFWRFHSLHHSDPAVDVTTAIRQHPVEGLIRYGFIALFAVPLGAGPAAFAIYRGCSALNALLEHANIRVPLWLDRALSWITTWPYMHKVHHSRRQSETDSNYGNLFSLWDRLFFTFTPSRRGADIAYGLDGQDTPASQTVGALLAMPFQSGSASLTGRVEEAP